MDEGEFAVDRHVAPDAGAAFDFRGHVEPVEGSYRLPVSAGWRVPPRCSRPNDTPMPVDDPRQVLQLAEALAQPALDLGRRWRIRLAAKHRQWHPLLPSWIFRRQKLET